MEVTTIIIIKAGLTNALNTFDYNLIGPIASKEATINGQEPAYRQAPVVTLKILINQS